MKVNRLSPFQLFVCHLQKGDILAREMMDALGTTALPPDGAIVDPPCLQCPASYPLSASKYLLAPPHVDIKWGYVSQRFVVALVIIVVDKGSDGFFQDAIKRFMCLNRRWSIRQRRNSPKFPNPGGSFWHPDPMCLGGLDWQQRGLVGVSVVSCARAVGTAEKGW